MTHHKPRSYAVDVARGFCLVIMTADHLPSNVLNRFSNVVFGPFGFFTAASGFVFLSGLVAAWTYGSIYREHGPAATWRHALRRAARVYVVNTSMFLLIFVGVSLHLLTGPTWQLQFAPIFSEPWTALFKGLLLLYRPGYLDILPMYILFLLIATPALAAIRASHSWAVMGLSALTWAWIQIAWPESKDLNAFAYQILFVAGLVIGSSPNMRDKLRSVAGIRIAKASLVLAACLLLARFGLGLLRYRGLDIPGWQTLIHLPNNGPLRLMNFALFALGAAYLWRQTPGQLKNLRLLRWFAHLGQHSLQVFAWSVLSTYISIALMPIYPNRLWCVIDMLLAVLSLTIPATLHARFTQRDQHRSLRQSASAV